MFRIREDQLISVRDQFSQNAARAVFLGRFVALLRIFAGPLAGIARMPYGEFFACNLAGAAVWASVMVSLSYFIGQVVPLEQLIAWTAQLGILALLGVAAWIGRTIWLDSRIRRSNETLSEEAACETPPSH